MVEGEEEGGEEEERRREASGGGADDQPGFPQFLRIVRKAARLQPSRPECGLIDLSCFCGRGIYLPGN